MRQQKQPRNPKRNKDHSICGQPWSEHRIVIGKVKGQIKPVWECPEHEGDPHDRKAY